MRVAGLRHDARDRFEAARTGDIGTRQNQRRRTIGNGSRTGRRDRTVLAEGRFERRDFRRVRLARLFVDCDDGFALSGLHRDGGDFIRERTIAHRALGTLQRFNRVGILILPRELVMAGGIFAISAHQAVLVSILQPVEEHMILHLAMTHAVTATRLRQQVGRIGHALHTADHDNVRPAQRDLIGADHHRLHAGAADLGNGRARHRVRNAGMDGGLPGGRLPQPGGEHIAHQRFVHRIGRDASAFHRRTDRRRAEIGGGDAGQLALKAPHRRACGGEDQRFGDCHDGFPFEAASIRSPNRLDHCSGVSCARFWP